MKCLASALQWGFSLIASPSSSIVNKGVAITLAARGEGLQMGRAPARNPRKRREVKYVYVLYPLQLDGAGN
jgi:hypothetical protein